MIINKLQIIHQIGWLNNLMKIKKEIRKGKDMLFKLKKNYKNKKIRIKKAK